jgi:Zn-dependent peptidase ImmA (M78 family)
MSDKIQQPVLSYEQIRERADDFLKAYNPQIKIPVPIEEIAEFSLDINIIPVPGLQKLIDCDGFISSDFSSITVDQFVLEERETRYRFTVAHEIGHLWLHKGVFEKFAFDSIDEWKEFQTNIDEETYGWLEWQAYAFGGLVLVPREPLASRRAFHAQRVSSVGLSPMTDAAQLQINKALAREFCVSTAVIEKRVMKDS